MTPLELKKLHSTTLSLGEQSAIAEPASADPVKSASPELALQTVSTYEDSQKTNEIEAQGAYHRRRLLDARPSDLVSLYNWVKSSIPEQLPLEVANREVGSVRLKPDADIAEKRRAFEEAGIRLTMTRHGQTEANRDGRLSGQSETPLTKEGRRQARAAAIEYFEDLGGDEWLKEAARDPEKLPVIYASPLSRAYGTAVELLIYIDERVNALATEGELTEADVRTVADGVHVRVDDRLKEVSFGAWENMDYREARKEDPHLFDSWDAYGENSLGVNFLDAFPDGEIPGESRLDVLSRVDTFLNDVLERHPGRDVHVFAHQLVLEPAMLRMGQVEVNEQGEIHSQSRHIPNATPLRLTGPNAPEPRVRKWSREIERAEKEARGETHGH